LAIKFKKIKQGCGEHESVNRLAQHNPMSIDAPHHDRYVFIAVEGRPERTLIGASWAILSS
jgi:hypothetical protein